MLAGEHPQGADEKTQGAHKNNHRQGWENPHDGKGNSSGAGSVAGGHTLSLVRFKISHRWNAEGIIGTLPMEGGAKCRYQQENSRRNQCRPEQATVPLGEEQTKRSDVNCSTQIGGNAERLCPKGKAGSDVLCAPGDGNILLFCHDFFLF